MKIVVEMSEAEYLATTRTVEGLFAKFIDEMSAMREVQRPPNMPVPPDDTSAASDYWKDEGLRTVEFDNHYDNDRPTGPDVARGETDDRGLSAQEEAPLPPKAKVRGSDLAKGRRAFEKLLRTWVQNFGVEGAEQPDRAEAMRALANGRNSFRVLAYVKEQGGLTYAVNALLPELLEQIDFDVYRKLVLDVAGNMTQVSSILFPDLSDLYEYKDIFRTEVEEEDDDE